MQYNIGELPTTCELSCGFRGFRGHTQGGKHQRGNVRALLLYNDQLKSPKTGR